jgi:hypothetical protein
VVDRQGLGRRSTGSDEGSIPCGAGSGAILPVPLDGLRGVTATRFALNLACAMVREVQGFDLASAPPDVRLICDTRF